MFNKDITHPRMRRKIKNPRVVLLDCPLEYKKGESQTNVLYLFEHYYLDLKSIFVIKVCSGSGCCCF